MNESNEQREFDLAMECVKRRQFHPRKPKEMSNVVAQIIAETGVGQSQSQQQLQSAWQKAAGDLIATVTRPGNIRRGTLEIFVENSAIMQQLSFKKQQLLDAISQQFGAAEIRDIRFMIGVIKS